MGILSFHFLLIFAYELSHFCCMGWWVFSHLLEYFALEKHFMCFVFLPWKSRENPILRTVLYFEEMDTDF